jgi:aminopeptidase N
MPYPFGKYDQLFVPEYNMGAMENAACVTFRDDYISGAARPARHTRAGRTPSSEMAHMWFGDLVTMKWWDDLWLNESFAEWASHHASTQATKYDDAWTSFCNSRKTWAYRQDQLPLDAPDRRGQLRPGGGRAQLRRHHLRQGRLSVASTGRLGG